ncbi:formamidopyrimidine-DNA glycosylase [Microbacterium sp. SLBN-154]|uniref:Fpg/Nei family DNA glycosylase n=1 Tax=Microbacterium sp. SLBN-154 TaxID=2768458 RepID=UPI001152E14C|nr:DNA-formamidopyrimidine glycosylase family protein [Microbacterium sp. SLBN-154]TQK19975.1 formamidopyrimidine-DNA glycosylase [Microbacterium sp. SLBN-154]
MPESPEVQVLADVLDDAVTHRRIIGVDVGEFRAWKTRDRPAEGLVGATITGVTRFGKHLDIDTDRGDLVVTLGRAGWVRHRVEAETGDDETVDSSDASSPPAAVIATLDLDDDTALEFTDAGEWLSLALSLVDHPQDVPAVKKLGPDPMSPTYTRADFDRITLGRRKQLKALLQEQESISGIGNAYSDEILHRAKIAPTTHAAALDDGEREVLFEAIRDELSEAVRARRSIPLPRLKQAKAASMRVHGRTGEACPVCGGVVEDVPGSKGAAQYCPVCQGPVD